MEQKETYCHHRQIISNQLKNDNSRGNRNIIYAYKLCVYIQIQADTGSRRHLAYPSGEGKGYDGWFVVDYGSNSQRVLRESGLVVSVERGGDIGGVAYGADYATR